MLSKIKELVMDFILLLSLAATVAGLLILWFVGEKVIEYALQVAAAFNVSTFFVGFVILAVAADLPEVAVAVTSALHGVSQISVGDLVGANFCDVALVTGITAMFAGVIDIAHHERKRLLTLISSTTVIMFVAFTIGTLTWWHGIILIAIYIFSLVNVWRQRNNIPGELQNLYPSTTPASKDLNRWWLIVKLLMCLGIVLASSSLIVYCVELFANTCGIPLETVGATILAAGTSLPELSLSLHALRKKEYALALGPTLGTVLEQCTLVLGLLVVLSQKPVDLTCMRGASVFMFIGFGIVAFSLMQRRIKRPVGIALVSLFVCYIAYHFC